MNKNFQKELENALSQIMVSFIEAEEYEELQVNIFLHRMNGITSVSTTQTAEGYIGEFMPTVYLEDPSNKLKPSKLKDVLDKINTMIDH